MKSFVLRTFLLSSAIFCAEASMKEKRVSPTPFGSRVINNKYANINRPKMREVSQFACTECISQWDDGSERKVRALYLEEVYTVENPVAEQAARDAGNDYPCGSCCLDPVLANPECFKPENWNAGWVAAPMLEVFQLLGANVEALTTANFTEETLVPSNGSPYERCIWEVYYGNVDVCVGSFWETASRRSMVMFTTAIDINNFILVTNAKLTEQFRAFSMFETFSPGVWAVMGGMFLLTALLMWIVQSEEAETDFDDDEVFPKIKGVAKGFWLSMMGYFAGPDPKYVTTSWAGRFIVLGYGFFLYVTVSAYTANLASFMVLKDKATGDVGSLKDLVDGGHKICADSVMHEMINQPGLDAESRLLSNHFGAILERLTSGDCKAAVVGKYEWRTYVTGSNADYVFCNDTKDGNYMQGFYCFEDTSEVAVVDLAECKCTEDGHQECPEDKRDCSDVFKFCNVIKIDDPSFDASVNVALPVSSALEPYISAWLVTLRQDGSINEYLASEIWSHNPDRCPSNTAQGSQKSAAQAQALTLSGMAGTYMISCAIMMIGVLIHIKDKIVQRSERLAAIADEEAGTAIPIGATGPGNTFPLHMLQKGVQHEVSTLGDLPDFGWKPPTQPAKAGGWVNNQDSFGSHASKTEIKPMPKQGDTSRRESCGSAASHESTESKSKGHTRRSRERHHVRQGAYTGGKPHLRGEGDFGSTWQFKGNRMRGTQSTRNLMAMKSHDPIMTLDAKVNNKMNDLNDDISSMRHEMHELAAAIKVVVGQSSRHLVQPVGTNPAEADLS